jgi:hypothetical protein
VDIESFFGQQPHFVSHKFSPPSLLTQHSTTLSLSPTHIHTLANLRDIHSKKIKRGNCRKGLYELSVCVCVCVQILSGTNFSNTFSEGEGKKREREQGEFCFHSKENTSDPQPVNRAKLILASTEAVANAVLIVIMRSDVLEKLKVSNG